MAIIALENHHIDSSAVSKLWQSYKEYENINIKLAETLSRCIPISVIEKKRNELKEVLDFVKTGKDEYSKGQASVLERTIKMIDKEILNERSNTDV